MEVSCAESTWWFYFFNFFSGGGDVSDLRKIDSSHELAASLSRAIKICQDSLNQLNLTQVKYCSAACIFAVAVILSLFLEVIFPINDSVSIIFYNLLKVSCLTFFYSFNFNFSSGGFDGPFTFHSFYGNHLEPYRKIGNFDWKIFDADFVGADQKQSLKTLFIPHGSIVTFQLWLW